MRNTTYLYRIFRSIWAKSAGALSFGVSILIAIGFSITSATAASAATAPIALNSAAVGTAYTSTALTVATAGTWAVSAGALPSGLALTSNASATTDTISGTPTADGNYAFTLTVTDSVTPATYLQAYTLTVNGIAPNPLTSPILVNTTYNSSTLTVATAGSWAITSGALPTGLALTSNASSATDTISGTPTVNGSYTFTITVTDAATPAMYVQSYTLVVASQVPQPKLKLFATIAALEHPIALITSGGSGTSAPTFAVTNGTATACTVTGTTLTATTIGTCIVTATEAGTATLLPVSSAPVTFTFVANPVIVSPVLTATQVKGHAVIGKTVTLTISGTDFHGRPKITSTNPGTRIVVRSDNGTVLTVRVTASKKAHKGSGTLTISEGSSLVKIKYSTV